MKIREERNLPAAQRFRQVDKRTAIMQHKPGWSPNLNTGGGGRSQGGAGYSAQLGGRGWDERFQNALQRKYDLMEREQDITADTATRGQDVWSGTTMRGHDITRELGIGELGIKKGDLDLDRAAWDFAQDRYSKYGEAGDKSKLLMGLQALTDMGVDPSALAGLLPFEMQGMFDLGGQTDLAPMSGMDYHDLPDYLQTPERLEENITNRFPDSPLITQGDSPGYLERIMNNFENLPLAGGDLLKYIDALLGR